VSVKTRIELSICGEVLTNVSDVKSTAAPYISESFRVLMGTTYLCSKWILLPTISYPRLQAPPKGSVALVRLAGYQREVTPQCMTAAMRYLIVVVELEGVEPSSKQTINKNH